MSNRRRSAAPAPAPAPQPAAPAPVEIENVSLDAPEHSTPESVQVEETALTPVAPLETAPAVQVPTAIVPVKVANMGEGIEKPAQKAPKDEKIKVVATQKGYYNNFRVNPGSVFTIKCEAHFSENWMERL